MTHGNQLDYPLRNICHSLNFLKREATDIGKFKAFQQIIASGGDMKPRNDHMGCKTHGPFVCQEEPFICAKKPQVLPLVVKIEPSVCLKSLGFTLIELMVTLAVAAILVLVAVPNMRAIIQNNRLTGLTNDLISDIAFARSEALKRSTNIGLCMSSSGTTCDGASWQAGRMIFVDANNSMSFDAGETVLRVRDAMPANTLTSAAPNPLVFNSRGLPANAAAGTTFALCDDRGATHGRSIIMSPTGQVSRDANPPGAC